LNRIEDQAAVFGLLCIQYAHVHAHTCTGPRLHLPGELVDDERQKASYDIDSGGYGMYNPNERILRYASWID
jgi:hypothetical protein